MKTIKVLNISYSAISKKPNKPHLRVFEGKHKDQITNSRRDHQMTRRATYQ